MATVSSSELIFLPAHALVAKLAAGETTSVELVNLFLDQIERHNRQGLELRAVISTCPRDIATREAQRLDEERKAGQVRSGLHGIPLVVKDTIMTSEALGMKTTAGAAVFHDMRAKRSAGIVDRVTDAGLIVLGKANLTEFTGHNDKDGPNGWSAMGGQTRTVFRRDGLKEEDQPQCGGSSSGSASSVSAGFVPLSIGCETSGSINYPASLNCLYAMKLTPGSVPVDGVFCITDTFDGLGPMARDPQDLAALAQIMLGGETKLLGRGKDGGAGAGAALNKGFQGLSVGVVERTWGVHESLQGFWKLPEVAETWENAVNKLKDLGAKVVYPLDTPDASTLTYDGENISTVSAYEIVEKFEDFINCFHPCYGITTLGDIIAWNDKHPDFAMPKPRVSQTELIACLHAALSPSKHENVVQELRKRAGPQGIELVMQKHGLDLVLSSSVATLVSWAAWAGWPVATVPLARLSRTGAPYGLFLLARKGREDVLLRFMEAWHEAFGVVETPRI